MCLLPQRSLTTGLETWTVAADQDCFGMPGHLDSWQGTTAAGNVEAVIAIGAGVGVWDAKLVARAWRGDLLGRLRACE